ncbi:hypothetical protein BHF71_09065 [Vulcanibacillus modesticaldus]|uniref:SAF domain-containing protein n=2 Tax=Vulcanibacillus modesticaldus TaxID=337097 RepID=A0A1D2YUV3_9BACI|nr:hypothetical protein BHF71_09065 [Vulcanibacillus modesticaldus]
MLAIVWFWETNGRERYFYQGVIVLNNDVKRGTIIKEEMLSTQKVEADKIIINAIRNKNEIIGLEAKHFIPQNTQLHPQYFEIQSLITSENRYIARIPNEWLYSIPNTLRRKDKVIFYQTNSGDYFNQDSINTHNKESLVEIKEKLVNPILETTIAYVKDGANREVKTISYGARLDGSSVIKEVLVAISPEEFRRLEYAVMNGSKLTIMHIEGE